MNVNSRESRRDSRRPRVAVAFGETTDAALDLLELVELAWHDCYGEVTPPDQVVEDILTVSEGRLDWMVSAARLAIEDFRDLRVNAEALRQEARATRTSTA